MAKPTGKAKMQTDAKVKQKPWPLVTSDVCERCPIQCPAGIAYMSLMRRGTRAGFGVACKKELYLQRKGIGLNPFYDVPKLIDRTKETAPQQVEMESP